MEYSQLEVYKTILEIVSNQLTVIGNRLDKQDAVLHILTEKVYIDKFKKRELSYNEIYVVLKFDEGTPMVGGIVQPFSLQILADEKYEEFCWSLLTLLATDYTFKEPLTTSTDLITQAYSTPVESEKFIEYFSGFGIHFNSSGTITYGYNTAGFKSVKIINQNNEAEEIVMLAYQISWTGTPNTANTGDRNDHALSNIKFGNLSFTFSTIPTLDCFLFKDVLFNMPLARTVSPNQTYNFEFTYLDNSVVTVPFKLINMESKKDIGSIPSISLGFAEAW